MRRAQDQFEQWRKGDFEAFLDLVRPHLPSLRALVAFYGLPSTSIWESDDLAQEALIEAFKSSHTYDPRRGDLRSWLGGIVRNRVRRTWQESKREQKRQERARFDLQRVAAEAETPTDVSLDPHVDALRLCMEKLPENGGRIIRAHYGEGLSCPEIADRLKMSVSAVYVTLHRVRRALRQCVEGSSGLKLEGARS